MISSLNRERLIPAGFKVRNIVPLGAGNKAVYRYERYTPPPPEPSPQPPTLHGPSELAPPEESRTKEEWEDRLAASITISPRVLTHFVIVALSPLVFKRQDKRWLPNNPLEVLEESVPGTEPLLRTLAEKVKSGVPQMVVRTFLIYSLIERIQYFWESTSSDDVKEFSAIQ